MRHRLLFKILLVVMVSAIATFYFFLPSMGFLPNMQCLLHLSTGLYCPGCGGQRAFHALLHGQFLHAMQHNLLLLPVLAVAGLKLFEELFDKKILPRSFYSPRVYIPIILFVLAFWVLRNIPFEPFIYLAPPK